MPADHYIKRRIREGEHQQQDFKFAISDSKKIARTLVAFANTDGGRLLVGVKDNGNIVGVKSEEEFYMIEAAAGMYCKPEVPITFKEHAVDGKKVLEVFVEKSELPMHTAPSADNKYMVYTRAADQNLLVNYIYVEAIKKRRRKNGKAFKLSQPVSILIDFLHEETETTLSQFCKIADVRSFIAKRIIIDLVALRVLGMRFTEKEVYYFLTDAVNDLELS